MANSVLGVILAGGLSSRMGGGDKTLRALAHKPILQHVIERFQPQVEPLIINANGVAARFSSTGLPIIPDALGDYAGPLAGILTALEWATQHYPHIKWVASSPADTPFLPPTLVAQLLAATQRENTLIATVRTQGFCHPVIGLWSVSLANDLRHALLEEHIHKVSQFTARHPLSVVDFDHTPIDPFFNINTPDDLATAELFLSAEK